MRIGKNIQHAWNFAVTYPGWHSYSRKCRATKAAITWLWTRGLIEIDENNTDMFRAVMTVTTNIKEALRLLPEYERIRASNAEQATQ